MLGRKLIIIALTVWCSLSFLTEATANPIQNPPDTAVMTAVQYIQSLKQNSVVMDLQLQYHANALQAANESLQQLEAKLNQERQRYTPKITATVARLRFLQQQSFSSQGWNALLNSQDLNEFFDRRDRLRQLYEADRERLATLQVQAIAIQRQKQAVEQKQADINRITQQIQTQKQDLNAQLALQQQILTEDNTQAQIQAAETQLRLASEQLEQLLQQRNLTPEMLAVTGTGQFIPPHAGDVTSLFGPRRHPVLGGNRIHTGIDYQGPYGSPVTAADSGVVVFADWYGGYGKTVAIAHGNDLATLYCHLKAIAVVEGQPIEQGGVIGEVGSTGLSTGPHLHFEVRQLGKPIDPAAYLPVNN